MRLFTGIDVPYQMKRNLELLLHHLRPKARLQWSPLENLHITTKFIGEWDERRLDELKGAIETVPRPAELRIAFRGLGWFPNPRQPRVFFVGITAPPGLPELARSIEHACARIGVQADNREYQPHLTLARIRQPVDLLPLKKAIAELPEADFGAFTAREYHLYRSELRPGGSLYTKLATFPFPA